MNSIEKYRLLIEQKKNTGEKQGIKPIWIPDTMFDYQAFVTREVIQRGRAAGYLDTGAGKTFIQLVEAHNYVLHTNKPVLIITPLAVAFQFLKEAEKFGIPDVFYSKDGKVRGKIVICNYERIAHFDPSDYECVILDESSILKNDEGKIRERVTNFLRKVKYRGLFTATPAPNDYVELGTSSEALGYLGHVDMLTRFFTNKENTIDPAFIGTEWRLKPHAETAFFEWVSSWAISMRKPSDLGFSNKGYEKPELIVNEHWVENKTPLVINGQYQMFNIVARTNQEIQAERRMTIQQRCEKAVELASAHETSVYWCNLNPEGDLITQLDKNAVQIKGSQSVDEKEEILLAFASGQIKHLVTKPKITGFGLNWQHCGHTTIFPSFSYEQYYQLISRFVRFGRKDPVIADLVFSDGQKRVADALFAKALKTEQMFELLSQNVNKDFTIVQKGFDKEIQLPSFL